MNEKQLKEIFKRGGNISNWKPVLDFVFGRVEYFYKANNPFTEDKKVVSGKQYGRITLDDGKSIALFEVQVDDSVNIERNRQGLREIAAKHIDQNITHGALVFYYSLKQEHYRLTFIAKWSDIDLETGELKKGETQKKRYTYLLGGNQSGTTAAKRLLELAGRQPVITIKDIIQAFSVEALTKEFFRKYKEHYERFWRFIDDTPDYKKLLLDTSSEKNDDEKSKPIRDFLKKMLGRIVFLHFLQKKGWMGCPVLATSKKNKEIWQNGDPSFLFNLYTNFKDKEHFYSKCLTKLFFATLNQPDRINNVFSITKNRVPYLNGGLFDNDQKHTDHIDFPAAYFQDLLEFFEQYNFTIDENSPDEQEVGIDPEMLGHIFENLLEENREKGAFYTPKEIVHYMCQESLAEYLKNHLPNEAHIDEFIRGQKVSIYLRDKTNATKLNSLLDEVKVCDPAIGSGAFPIGILQEIYKAKIHIYPYIKSSIPFNPAETKKKIIEESIYGVDLEHGAVEIARLRFWLALVVDEDVPQPLPNLDYKIMQGNSLVERFEGIDLSLVGTTNNDVTIIEPDRDLFGSLIESQMKVTFTQTETVREIQKLIRHYFSERDPTEKAVLKAKISDKVHQHIDYNLELRETQLARMIAEAGNENNLNAKARKKLDGLKKELASFTQKRATLHKIQNTEEKPYFIWHLFFKDVFDRGGFDIVIGNPPYIQLQKMGKDADILQEVGFDTFTRTGDIYCLFYEMGNKILKNNGNLIYITSNSWLRSNYGKYLRRYFIGETNPLVLIDLSDSNIFQTATVRTSIFQFKKQKNKNSLKAIRLNRKTQEYIKILNNYISENFVLLKNTSENAWVVNEKEKAIIKRTVEEQGRPLKEWMIEINRGIITGFNEAFVIDENKRDELIQKDFRSEEIIKPFLRGRDIERYHVNYKNLYLINAHNGIKEKHIPRIDIFKDYPIIAEHLQGFEKELEKRFDQGDHWSNLRNCTYIEEFEKPKIIYPNMVKDISFTFDSKGYYTNQKSFFLIGEKMKYLLGIFNSKLFRYCFEEDFPEVQGNSREINKVVFEEIPIKYPNKTEENAVSFLVDYILFLHERDNQLLSHTPNNRLATTIEEVLNMVIYELYFGEHMNNNQLNVIEYLRISELLIEPSPEAIVNFYLWLQQPENPIRNRIIAVDIKSPEYISRINTASY